MAGIKTLLNTQWGRVLASLSSAVPSADNEGREPSVTPTGALWVQGADNVPSQQPYQTKEYYSSAALLANGLVATGECDLLQFYGFKASPAVLRYLLIFDAIALPVDTTIPFISIPLPATTTPVFSLTTPVLSVPARMFLTGVFFACSSTPNTLTFNAGTTVWLNAMVGKPYP